MGKRRKLLSVAMLVAYASVFVVIGLLVTGSKLASAADSGQVCDADTNGDNQLSRSEAVDAVTEYLLGTSPLGRSEVVDIVTVFLLGRDLDCSGVFIPPAPQTPSGEAVIALGPNSVSSENGLNQAQSPELIHYYGMGETMFLRADDDSTLPWLATDWSIESDLSGATMTIQSGVKFHVVDGNDFGELTAQDVAWSMNNANATTNPNSIHGQAGDFAGLFKEWVAINDTTVTFEFESFDNTWKDDFINQSGQAFVVFSKQAFDDMGIDWVRSHVVATGPYQPVEWIGNDRLVMEAVPNHWKFQPKTTRITVLEISDPATRAAMLRNGEVDATTLNPNDAPPFINGGFGKTSTGGGNQEGLFFSGNLWELYSAREGEGEGEPNETLLSRDTYVNDFPWIGDPYNPADPDDMEEARLVRRALAIAYDRQAIVDNVLAGLGDINHVQYFSHHHPNWDSKWDYYYDPDEAAAIISGLDANYFKGSGGDALNGNAFEISIYSQDGNTNIRGEIADAVAGYWAQLGLEVYSLKYVYRTFRPGVVARTNVIPWITQCDKGVESTPWHSPKGLVQSSLSRGGFSCGFESPEITDFYLRMAAATDLAEATLAANEYLDYVYYWNLQPGVVTLPADVYYNPNKIAAWPMAKSSTSMVDSFWNLEVK
jgi:ABC-type transport system substrate-binding protein